MGTVHPWLGSVLACMGQGTGGAVQEVHGLVQAW
jgi:hypothetical protein